MANNGAYASVYSKLTRSSNTQWPTVKCGLDSRTLHKKACGADFFTLVHSHDLRASSPASTPGTMHSSTIVILSND